MAEYGFEVYNSAAYLEELLEKEGFTVERGIGGMKTAFVGTCGSGKPVIGILAEYDALPNMSQKAGETKPCPIEGKKYGHACGHSALAAGTVGAAIIAKEYLKETGKTGTVRFLAVRRKKLVLVRALWSREAVLKALICVLPGIP